MEYIIIVVVAGLGVCILLLTIFVWTLAHWRFLSWPRRLLGLLTLPILVLLVIWLNRPMWKDL